MDKYVGYLSGVNVLFFKGFNNDIVCFLFIFVINFCFGYFVSVGNCIVEIVGVGGVCCWNWLICLCLDSCVV